MSKEQLKNLAAKTTAATRRGVWKFFGAMLMEEKNGVQAVSLHRFLALTTYAACMILWLGLSGRTVAADVQAALAAAEIDVPSALKLASAVPDAMLYTLWGLLGINGAAKVAGVFKGGGNGQSEPRA